MKRKAMAAVNKAVAQGILSRPKECQVCGSRAGAILRHGSYTLTKGPRKGHTNSWIELEASGSIVAHHWAGYDQENWLNIWWVCRRCNVRLTSHDGSQSLEQAKAFSAQWQPRWRLRLTTAST